jgi:regulator of sirC expression with transglutaminase-like and TPR domain
LSAFDAVADRHRRGGSLGDVYLHAAIRLGKGVEEFCFTHDLILCVEVNDHAFDEPASGLEAEQ